MQLIYYPNPILSSQCEPVPDSGADQKRKRRLELANKMWTIMNKHGGVGLSAPQVGLNIRLFMWNQHSGKQLYNQAIWNPVLSCVSGLSQSIEGCLSLPKINVTIQRATSSILTGTGFNGRPLRFIGDAITTRIWQHEINHLDGKLIIDNMSPEDYETNRDALSILLKNEKSKQCSETETS